MQEKKLVELLEDLMSDICDNNCKKIDSKTEEEAEEICDQCPAGDHICRVLNENVRYKKDRPLRRMRILHRGDACTSPRKGVR